ncbi:hypothetical protein A8C32_18105 [Flavivirga aquatica]|uniref:Disease resistance R13L4/SHOC-2-like LRR domain-containing protein n=1 Tax=Flavivirga aquatica TaxID=1849968 RepID=A0A1E5T7L6_9FLAO|nr:hypothetical protein [Flavivirga aquatica]OEK07350.1 hypothetical protein A8C32_18105 [Flavivirga aquatica]
MSFKQVFNDIKRRYPERNTETISLRDVDLSGLSPKNYKKLITSLNRRYRNLQGLDLSNTNINELPKEIGRLNNLRTLNLSGNNLSQLPSTIRRLNLLTALNLESNDFHDQFPPAVINLNNLRTLNLAKNTINQLPAEIGQLNNLNTLNLAENNLNQLPAEIGQLNNLRVLNLAENNLKQLPVEIGRLNNITDLNLHLNDLEQLPAEIGQLNNLENLNISNNSEMQELPPEIGNLNNLTYLYANNNRSLTSLPTDIQRLNQLRHLNISNNQNLTQLPREIGQLNNLITLEASGNSQVTQIPGEISNLNNLRYLNISNNQNLTQLPREIGQLNSLINFNMSGNPQVTQIPIEINNLNSLRYFDISNNPQLSVNNMDQGMLARIQRSEVNIQYHNTSREVTNLLNETLGINRDLLEYEKTLQKLYTGDRLHKMMEFIGNLDDGLSEDNSYTTGSLKTAPDEELERYNKKILPAKEVLIQLLERYPKSEGEHQKYFDASLKNMLDQFDIKDVRFENINNKAHLASLAVCLGDCLTPIKDRIVKNMLVANDLDLNVEPFILRMALQDKIASSFSKELNEIWDKETIEVANAFTNCALLENADKNPENPLKVSGDRAYSPSLSSYTDLGFKNIKEKANPELLENVAKLFCKEDGENRLEKNDGKYKIDTEKLEAIKKEYLEKELGSNLSRREIEVKNKLYEFEKEFEAFYMKYDEQFGNENNDRSIFEVAYSDSEDIQNEFSKVTDVDALKSKLEEKFKKSDSLKETKDAFMKQCKTDFEKCMDDYMKEERLKKERKKLSIDQLAAVPTMSQKKPRNSQQSQNSRLSRRASRQLA